MCSPGAWVGLSLLNQLTAAEVAASGLGISGDTSLLDRILPGKEAAYPNQPPPDRPQRSRENQRDQRQARGRDLRA
jgi:hypothetical protein